MSSFPLVNGLPYPPNPIGPIVSVGTVQGTDFLLGSGGPSTKSSLAGRGARQGLLFNGTAGCTVTPNVSSFGTTDFTVAAWISVSSLAANNVICDGTNAFAFYVATDGSLRRLDRVGAATNATAAGVITTGKTYFVAYVRGALYVNGILQTTFTDTSNYSGTISRVGWAISNDSYWTNFLSVLAYNRALTASELVALYEAGVPSGADYVPGGANNTSLITGANSTFSSDTGYWNKVFGATIGGGQCTLPSGGGMIYVAGLLTKGVKYRLSVNIVTNNAYGLYVQNVADLGYGYILGTGTKTFEFTAAGTGAVNFGLQNQLGSGSIVIDDVTLVPVGLLLAPDAAQFGGGQAWIDTSGNGCQILLPSSGVSFAVAANGTYALRGSTSTNGNQQMLGANSVPAGSHITMAAIRCVTGTPTVTLGTAAGGNQIANAVTLATNTWTEVTVKAAGGVFNAAGSVWVNSNSTDVIQLCFMIQPLSL